MKSLNPVLLFTLFLLLSCSGTTNYPAKDVTVYSSVSKINGASMVASKKPVKDAEFIALKNHSVNYVCLLPFAYVREGDTRVFYNADFQWWGERPEGISECIRMAHDHGMQVMIKPQLWVNHGTYTGHLSYKDDNEWKAFEQHYAKYIFQLVHIADSLHAEMFCIGTELDAFVRSRTDFWSSLIDSVRSVYDGKIIYAANWDCYDDFPFWNKLDAMGINAYFPLSDSITPQVNELLQKWEPHYIEMRSFSEKTGRPVIFTEYGYRSIDYATRKPWESYTDGITNVAAQKNAYEALYQKFWMESWMEGGFFWKWFDQHTPGDVPADEDFTPQDKPAMEVIKRWYGPQ